ncbi:MAG: hypothetical protein Q7U33_04165 [Methylotenera sp.]|uniref:hypothetical protein n=1 Tax=Methylotenera sp. TaxID=2051956 RepID=UPI0027204EB9|nr:hypothetical protein [Methylotenera sp.]MDO9150554.1 hypothetical protein [Methylotenera sp.]
MSVANDVCSNETLDFVAKGVSDAMLLAIVSSPVAVPTFRNISPRMRLLIEELQCGVRMNAFSYATTHIALFAFLPYFGRCI